MSVIKKKSAKKVKKSRSKSQPSVNDAQIEKELKKVHAAMQKSLNKLDRLISEVADDKSGKAAKHLLDFHSKQKRHLENIRKKIK